MNKRIDPSPTAIPALDVCERSEICALASVRRVAAMLDQNPNDFAQNLPLPRGWQFILMAADTRRSLLRADGFPGLGISIPDLGLPRLLLGGRKVTYKKDIPIGSEIRRCSSVRSLTRKESAAGPMAITTIQHALHLGADEQPALIEEQTYLLLPARKDDSHNEATTRHKLSAGAHTSIVTPDETMLFQYSALGFNSHRIHIDPAHARNVEGFPDLVVNGGLVTLLMTEFLRRDVGITPSALKVRHIAPLFCGRPITLVANPLEGQWQVQAYDHRNSLAVDMEVLVS